MPSSNPIQRYDCETMQRGHGYLSYEYGAMEPCDEGEYVKHADHLTAMQEVEKERDELDERMAEWIGMVDDAEQRGFDQAARRIEKAERRAIEAEGKLVEARDAYKFIVEFLTAATLADSDPPIQADVSSDTDSSSLLKADSDPPEGPCDLSKRIPMLRYAARTIDGQFAGFAAELRELADELADSRTSTCETCGGDREVEVEEMRGAQFIPIAKPCPDCKPPEEPRRCPDDGKCHHACQSDECFRVRFAAPLSEYGDVWTADDVERFGTETQPPEAPKTFTELRDRFVDPEKEQLREELKRLRDNCPHPDMTLNPGDGTMTCDLCGHTESDPFSAAQDTPKEETK